MNAIWALTGAVVGAALAWLYLRERERARVAALEAALDAERRFAEERRVHHARADALIDQLAALADTQQGLSAQARHLVDSLRSPVVRGRWGELQLQRVCELAQMSEHVDFEVQRGVQSGDGVQRPDLLVNLPGDRCIVVDAKAPLSAWLDAMEATDDAQRTDALRRHARHVRDHITRLSAKAYWEQFRTSPEFVVLFLPGESLFGAALQYDATLIEFGVERGVILASPTTLIAMLRATSLGWERVEVSRHADDIRELGVELHGRLESWSSHLGEVRRGLERAVDAYGRAVGALEQRVLPQARRFGKLTGQGETVGDGLGDRELAHRLALTRDPAIVPEDSTSP